MSWFLFLPDISSDLPVRGLARGSISPAEPLSLFLPERHHQRGGEDTETERPDPEEEEFLVDLLSEWTGGLDPLQQRISIFTHIRDIPYAIVPEWRDGTQIIRRMIEENRGWCGPKHHLLARLFQRTGIETRMVFIPFRWQDQQVRYPAELTAALPLLPDTLHLCCRARLGESWPLIDATWDPPLQAAGFPVNTDWDGLSGTLPAVRTRDGITGGCRQVRVSPEIHRLRAGFVPSLNAWLEELRNGEKRGNSGRSPQQDRI